MWLQAGLTDAVHMGRECFRVSVGTLHDGCGITFVSHVVASDGLD